jgi:hypothetical protein
MENYFGLAEKKIKLIKKLNTPKKVQDFLNSLEMNFEPNGDECNSPKVVLETKKAHCIEGALLAAIILRYHGREALLLDLESTNSDFDHVVTLFKENNCWGAISKTNHAVLRYREPIYKTLRELVLSYFHEYFLNSTGTKTLRAYSDPVNLKIFDKTNWVTSNEDIWFIPEHLTKIKHYKILTRKQIRTLRKADPVERKAGEIVEYALIK